MTSRRGRVGMRFFEEFEYPEDSGKLRVKGAPPFAPQVPVWAISYLSSPQLKVYVGLLSFADCHTGLNCFPSLTNLCERVNLSERQVRLHLHALRDLNVLRTYRRVRSDGGDAPNYNEVAFDAPFDDEDANEPLPRERTEVIPNWKRDEAVPEYAQLVADEDRERRRFEHEAEGAGEDAERGGDQGYASDLRGLRSAAPQTPPAESPPPPWDIPGQPNQGPEKESLASLDSLPARIEGGSQQEIFVAIAEAWRGPGGDRGLTRAEAGRIAQAAKQLRDAGATPQQVHERWLEGVARFDGRMTPQTLMSSWGSLAHSPPRLRDHRGNPTPTAWMLKANQTQREREHEDGARRMAEVFRDHERHLAQRQLPAGD